MRTNMNHLENLNIDELKKIIDNKEGVTYSNLCKCIGIKYLHGNSKVTQLRELKSICNFHKEGRFFYFSSLNKKGNTLSKEQLKYPFLIENLLINYFIEHPEKESEFFTTKQLMEYIGLSNKNFTFIKNKKDTWLKKNAIITYHKEDFNSFELNFFLNNIYSIILKPILQNVIQSINTKGIITFQKGYKGVLENKNGYSVVNILPNSQDDIVLKKICEECYDELKIKNPQQLFLRGTESVNKYFKRRNELCAEKTKYFKFYDCYIVTFNQDKINNLVKYDSDRIRKEINKKVIKRISNNKTFKSLSINGQSNLINAFIKLDTRYDFIYDYIEYKKQNGIIN